MKQIREKLLKNRIKCHLVSPKLFTLQLPVFLMLLQWGGKSLSALFAGIQKPTNKIYVSSVDTIVVSQRGKYRKIKNYAFERLDWKGRRSPHLVETEIRLLQLKAQHERLF